MLIQFAVTNFLSFRDEMVLSLDTNKDDSHSEILLSYKNERILPSVAIYGANAAGKSNLHKALTAAIIMIRNSNNLQVDQPLMVTPFLLDKKSRFEKTKFDFIYTNNGIKYQYGFVLDAQHVWEEYLYEYKSTKPSMIFERSDINKYKFTARSKPQLSKIVNKNTSNKLFLATATSWNSDLTRNAYMWFSNMIDTYDSSNLEDLMFREFDRHQKDKDDSLNEFMLHLLKKADINIGDDLKLVNLEKDEITEECMQIWHLYREYIKSFCSFQLKDCPDCVEDCVQDVFMALLEARRAGKEIKNPKAWLTRVANNKIIDEYKNKAREAEHINRIVQYETALKISAVEMPQLNDVSDELIDEMTDNILNRLKADERSLVEDYYMEDMRVRDIAAMHGLSETNVKQKLFRARKKIMHLSNKEIEKHKF